MGRFSRVDTVLGGFVKSHGGLPELVLFVLLLWYMLEKTVSFPYSMSIVRPQPTKQNMPMPFRAMSLPLHPLGSRLLPYHSPFISCQNR